MLINKTFFSFYTGNVFRKTQSCLHNFHLYTSFKTFPLKQKTRFFLVVGKQSLWLQTVSNGFLLFEVGDQVLEKFLELISNFSENKSYFSSNLPEDL